MKPSLGKRSVRLALGWLPLVAAALAASASHAYVVASNNVLTGVPYAWRVNAQGQAEIRINVGEQIKYAKALGKRPDVFLAAWTAAHGNEFRGQSLGTELVANVTFNAAPNQVGLEDGQYQMILPEDYLVQSSMNMGGTPYIKLLYNGVTDTNKPIPANSSMAKTINNPNMPVTGILLDMACDWQGRDTSTADMRTWCTITGGWRYTNLAYSHYDADFAVVPHSDDTKPGVTLRFMRPDSIFEGGDFSGGKNPQLWDLKDQYGDVWPVSANYNAAYSWQLHVQDTVGSNMSMYGPSSVTVWSHKEAPLTQNHWNNGYVVSRLNNTTASPLYGLIRMYAWDEVADGNGAIWPSFHRNASIVASQSSQMSVIPAGGKQIRALAEDNNQKVYSAISALGSRYVSIGLLRPMVTIDGGGAAVYPGELIKLAYPFRRKANGSAGFLANGFNGGQIQVTPDFLSTQIMSGLKGVAP